MKAEDMVMVIENRKGQETNSLLTFDDFIKQHIVPFANDKLEAVFMARELMDIRSKKIDSWADWYHSANQSFMPESVQIVRRLVIFCVEPLMMIRTFDLMKISAVKNAWKNFAAEE